MLDWLEPLLTPCPRHLRAMGYLRELMNIRRCARWWEAAWQPHLERTRALILHAAERCPRRRKAVILGSGLLCDVPLPQLSATFDEVVLVDLLHPFRTRRRVRRYSNVGTLAADLSGVVEQVHCQAAITDAPLPRATPTLFIGDDEVDLVASVNLLSQLPCMPVGYLKRVGGHAREAIEGFARDIVRAHLDYLHRLPGVVAVIADYEALTLNANGDVLKRESTVYDVELPWPGEEWTWRLVPLTRQPPHRSEWLKVRGMIRP